MRSATARGAAIGVILLLTAALGWQYWRAEQAEKQLGLDASRVLSAVFTQAKDLRVATLSGEVVARSENEGTIFRTQQVTKAPYRSAYFIDLGRVGVRDYAWDADRRVMTIRIPDIIVERPAIDLAKAEVRQSGTWVSRQAGIALQRQGSQRLADAAYEKARSPENMARARAATVHAVTRLVRQPLVAAGFGDVGVVVRYPWEDGGPTERWDQSRSAAEVVGNDR